jgi:hypothetical protein
MLQIQRFVACSGPVKTQNSPPVKQSVHTWLLNEKITRLKPLTSSVQCNGLGGTFPCFIHSFIPQWLYSPLLGPGFFFSFVIYFTQTVGLLEWVISPSQGRYLKTGQHKHREKAYTNIHVLSGIRTHDPSFRASEDSSCLRSHCHCDQHSHTSNLTNFLVSVRHSTVLRLPLWHAAVWSPLYELSRHGRNAAMMPLLQAV